MSDTAGLVADAAAQVLRDLCTPEVINEAEQGRWPAALWASLESSGFTLTWVPEALGGGGGEIADAFAVLRVAGQFAAPVPLSETLLAGFVLARAGLSAPSGPLSVAPVYGDDRIELAPDGRLRGTARRVPFARNAGSVAVLARSGDRTLVARVAVGQCRLIHGMNLAGEPSDDLVLDGVAPEEAAEAPGGFSAESLQALGAAVRTAQMAGALQRILDQSVEHALGRVQFGRPIAKFQVIQHNLAQLAGEAAAAGAAADSAAEAIGPGNLLDDTTIAEIAAAKVRVGEAASTGAAIAHQVHGAMGFTYEHSLHHATRRLWAWRDDFGNETVWSIRLGQIVARQGPDGLWPFITATGQAD